MAAVSTLALLALSAATTAGKYSTQRSAASAADAEGNYTGDLLDRNAGVSDLQAADVLQRGREGELASRRGSRILHGDQRAALAASGVNIDSGSAADVQANDQALSELDALTIRNNARREAWGYQVQAADQRRQAGLARTAGKNAAQSMRRQSVGTLLAGAGELANLWSSAPKSPSASRYTASGAARGGVL